MIRATHLVTNITNNFDRAEPPDAVMRVIGANGGHAVRTRGVSERILGRMGWSLYFEGSLPAGARSALKREGYSYSGTHWARGDR